jgi:hypothetical protein
MRYLILFNLFFSLLTPSSRANEAMMQSMQAQMASFETLVQSMQSTITDLSKTVENQNAVIEQQNIRINALEGPKLSAQAQTESPLKVTGLSQGFNPDIGVVGTVQAHITEDGEDAEGKDTITLKELELSFAQYVDPYSRLDAVIAFNDNLEAQNVNIEEAYYTHWGLPWGFVGRIGKFRTLVGKQNLEHLHQLDTANYALVIRNFFGEEGISSSGLRLQNFLPNPWDIPIEITGEILRGNNGDSFGGISRRPIFNIHSDVFFELSDDMTLEIGGTWMNGDENVTGSVKGSDNFGVHIFGGDATLLWSMEDGRHMKWQSELYYQHRTARITPNINPWGFYTLLDVPLSEKFSAGIRFDYLQPREVDGEHDESYEISPYVTFWQSEFANFRLQYSHVEPAANDDESDDAVFLQANFLIGAHSHPVA